MAEPSQAQHRVVGSWALSTHIGQGSFAIVWRARHVETGEEAAVKEINLSKLNAKLRQSLESEVSILKRINHENIVKLHEVLEEEDRMFLVMEYCAGGDLAHFLRRVKRVPEATAQHLMRQLAAGLRQMWAHHLVHRDLKPQNLLLSAPSPTATLKIADFGFARNLQPQGLAETLCGSPLYMAPEILHFHKYDAKADLWSIGAILYELVVGRPPFTGANQFQLLRNIERSDARVPEAIAATLSPPCRHLIHCLLRRNPVERLSFEEFFRHPFVATPEEMAAPLPPRPPYGAASVSAGGAISASLAAAGAAAAAAARPQQQRQQQQQRMLLFSTSAPAAAAAAAALVKSRSANSIPQQVLGFQQQQQPGQGPGTGMGPAAGGRLGMPRGAAAGAGAPAGGGTSGTAVPLGGLSHQLKPRRSLDLGGLVPSQQQQQQPQQQQQQQRRPQPVPGHRLGSIQRVHGFQPAPLPGQQQQQQQLPGATAAAAAPQAALQTPFAALASAAPPSQPVLTAASSTPVQCQPGQQRQQQGGAAAAVGAAAAAGAGSTHSQDDEDDYVMVDTTLSAHTATGRSRQGSPHASHSGSAEASLNNSRHMYGSTEAEDVFGAHLGDAAPAALGTSAAPSPPWLAPNRWQRLYDVACVMRASADARQPARPGQQGAAAGMHHQPLLRECLSLHLAALQLLEQAMEAQAVAAAEAREQGALDAAAELATASMQLHAEAAACMQAAEAAAEVLHKSGRDPSPTTVTPAAVAAAEAEAALPDPWELLYAAALGWGREAAVDELLGNQQRSCQLYQQAGTALSFLSSEAAELELEPAAELAPADRARLQKYAAATAARWASCAAQAAKAGSGG